VSPGSPLRLCLFRAQAYHLDMAHNSNPVQRTAPIPIAPKPPRLEPAPQRQDNSLRRFEIGPASLHARGSTDSVSASAPTSNNARARSPCQACRYAGTRCIPSEDEEGCMSCQVNAAECSLSSSPQSRKRKLNGESSVEISGKRRFVSRNSITREIRTPPSHPSHFTSSFACVLLTGSQAPFPIISRGPIYPVDDNSV
jgi:hypothetical protein